MMTQTPRTVTLMIEAKILRRSREELIDSGADVDANVMLTAAPINLPVVQANS